MTLSYLIAVIHVATLAIGFSGLFIRSRALKAMQSSKDVSDVFYGDNLYGVAALLWVGTGVWRAFGGLEKGGDYYLSSTAFLIKLSLFGLIFLFELYPMVTLIKWRIAKKRGYAFDISPKKTLYNLCNVQLVLLLAIVFFAVAMSRGMWY